MRRAYTAALLAMIAVAAFASEPAAGSLVVEGLLAEAGSADDLRRMALAGLARTNDAEIAAFVVRTSDGTLALQPWPDRFYRRRQTFRGSVPAGAIAIIHTHPPGASPLPSEGDFVLARATGLPVIAVSRRAIWIAAPGAEAAYPVVERRNWIAESARR